MALLHKSALSGFHVMNPAFTGGVYEQLDTHDVQDPELGRV